MSDTSTLYDLLIFFGLTIIFVPLFKRLKLGSVMGYLTAGILVGPYVLGLITEKSNILHLGEMGLVLLLFIIGQELSPVRLKALRSKILIDGGSQFFVTAALACIPAFILTQDFISSLLIAFAISLSSTAVALNYLKESKSLTLSYGNTAFSTLLFQDIIIVPIMTIIPFVSGKSVLSSLSFSSFLFKIGIIAASFAFLTFALKPLMSFVKKESHEVFTAFCLLVIIGMSYAMEQVGLSKALGSFLAGVFLSNSDFKKDIEQVILPFKSMFMGIFFMSIGLQFNVEFLIRNFWAVASTTLLIIGLKGSVLLPLGYIRLKSLKKASKYSLILSHGGEFSLVLLSLCYKFNILNTYRFELLLCSVAFSLILAPILSKSTEWIKWLDESQDGLKSQEDGNIVLLRPKNNIESEESKYDLAS